VLVARSESLYADEWLATNEQGLRDIAAAAAAAGLPDCNGLLNAAVGKETLKLRERLPDDIRVLDVGCGSGNTSLAVLEQLGSTMRGVVLHLLDPNGTTITEARSRIGMARLQGSIHLETHNAPDLTIANLFPAPTFDLVISSAALHHHAFLPPLFEALARALKPGGLIVAGDWHSTMWHSPGAVCELLDTFDWAGKPVDLGHFSDRFACEHSPEPDPLLQRANQQISAFWSAYADVKHANSSPYELLEGHRRPSDYSCMMEMAGLRLLGPPRILLPGSALLCVHAAAKPR
jgi:SAM-dependent methyltransferase